VLLYVYRYGLIECRKEVFIEVWTWYLLFNNYQYYVEIKCQLDATD
jgi:hypothetical protein